MTDEKQALLIGAGAGAVTFVAFFGFWLKTNLDSIQHGSEDFAKQVAEEAAKQYLAQRFGLTAERLRQVRNTVQAVQAMTGGR